MGRIQSMAGADGAGGDPFAHGNGRRRAAGGPRRRNRGNRGGCWPARIQHLPCRCRPDFAARGRREGVQMTAKHRKPVLDRRKAAAEILKQRGDALVVAGLGAPCWDVVAVGDNPLNFYTWGAMGSAAMIGLGLALAQPKRRVLVITGDGEMLMGMGSLATIGIQRPGNLAIVVFDNGVYGETGMQPSHTQGGVDLLR